MSCSRSTGGMWAGRLRQNGAAFAALGPALRTAQLKGRGPGKGEGMHKGRSAGKGRGTHKGALQVDPHPPIARQECPAGSTWGSPYAPTGGDAGGSPGCSRAAVGNKGSVGGISSSSAIPCVSGAASSSWCPPVGGFGSSSAIPCVSGAACSSWYPPGAAVGGQVAPPHWTFARHAAVEGVPFRLALRALLLPRSVGPRAR